ncbi:MAG: V-type ATPase subunit [Lachnoclostridium sp.]|jgi:V/A-type H+-transporting ATPase subunit C|nr:V-type ATPase subunit [Lachnoclostridium sp.]
MLTKQLQDSGIVTKARAIKAHILKDSDYEKIINMSSVSEVLAFLKEKEGYKELFRELDTNSSRGKIEHELSYMLQITYAKLYRFASKKQRNTIRIYFYRFEIYVIKICLQRILRVEEEEVDFSLSLDFFRKHSEIDLEQILAAKTIEGLLEVLKKTSYYSVIYDVYNLVDPSLFDYETRLDIFNYKRLWKMKDDVLKGSERRAFEEVFGREIDLLNLSWIYRFKTAFDTDTGKILKSIIPIHYKLSKKQVSNMIMSENIMELNELIHKCPYQNLFPDDMIRKEDVETCERRYVERIYRKYAKKNAYSIIPILYLLRLKEHEIDKLTTAIECIRYKLPVEHSREILENF